MFNIYRKIRRHNLTVQKVAPITARESRRKRRPPTHRPPDKNINSVRRQNKRHKKSVIPIPTTQNRAQNFHNTVTARRNRTEITAKNAQKLVTTTIARLCAAVIKTKSLRTFRKKHIDLGETAVEERKKGRITPSKSLKKKPSHSKKQQNRSNQSRKHNNCVKRSDNYRTFV